MGSSEAENLLKLWDKNICPFCGKFIPEGTRVGSGKKSEGGFCSLGCYADYHKTDLLERAKKVAALAAQHCNS